MLFETILDLEKLPNLESIHITGMYYYWDEEPHTPVIPENNETEANNNWLQGHIVNNEIQSYLEVLNGHACVIQHDGELYISDICIDRTALYIDVAYYNINHPNDRITEAQLLSELNGYMDGGSVEHLEAFREWDNGGNHGECALFRENIICYLRDTYGVNLHYATQEQLDEAINYASQQ